MTDLIIASDLFNAQIFSSEMTLPTYVTMEIKYCFVLYPDDETKIDISNLETLPQLHGLIQETL